jgi:hypothetical protein
MIKTLWKTSQRSYILHLPAHQFKHISTVVGDSFGPRRRRHILLLPSTLARNGNAWNLLLGNYYSRFGIYISILSMDSHNGGYPLCRISIRLCFSQDPLGSGVADNDIRDTRRCPFLSHLRPLH